MIIFKITSQFRESIKTVRSNKLRSFWTMVGIIIGVTSVICIVAIGEGIKQQISGQIHQYGKDLITVQSASIKLGSSSANSSSLSNLTSLTVSTPMNYRDVEAVSNVNGLGSSSPLTIVSGSVKSSNGVYRDGYVLGVSDQLPQLLNQSVEYGSFFSDDGATDTNLAVLGQNAANAMFNEDVPLGRSFIFRGQTFIVVGIFNQFTVTPLSNQANLNDAIFISNDLAESLTNNTAPTYEILARASDPSETNIVAKNIRSALNDEHGGYSGISVFIGSGDLSSNNDVLDLLTKLIAGIAAISLLVAGIGIMNVMLVSVSERVREIGIRKAVGATNQQIRSQFMFEAIFISFTGGIIGIALSYLIVLFIRLATDLTPVISWPVVALASGVSLLVGIVFGTIPAVKAARKDPIDALRAE